MHQVNCNLAVSLLQPSNLLHATGLHCSMSGVFEQCLERVCNGHLRKVNAAAVLHCQLGSN